jgi:small subunit ribosomal protein S19
MAKGFRYKGKSLEELGSMDLKELAKIFPSRARRSLIRGLPTEQQKFIEKIKKKDQTGDKKPLKTHLREMLVLPVMIGKNISIYNGKEYKQVQIEPDMLGLRLGDLSLTRNKVAHNAPGIGATRSSSALSVK